MSSDPVLIAYSVRQSIENPNRRYWTRIGEAYPHEQGAGLTVQLDALPRDGRIVLLELDDADDRRLAKTAGRVSRQRSAVRRP